MLALIPLPYRLLALAALIAASVAFGWVKGAVHVRAEWDAATAEESSVVARQQIRVEKIEAAQKLTTEKISHEVDNALARSDAYWGGVRYPSRPGRLPEIPGAAAATDAAAETTPPDPAGDPPRSDCTPADGSADAIVILLLQRWFREVKAAQESAPDNAPSRGGFSF